MTEAEQLMKRQLRHDLNCHLYREFQSYIEWTGIKTEGMKESDYHSVEVVQIGDTNGIRAVTRFSPSSEPLKDGQLEVLICFATSNMKNATAFEKMVKELEANSENESRGIQWIDRGHATSYYFRYRTKSRQ